MALLDLLNKFNENQTVLGISLLPSSERLMKMIVTLRNHDFEDNEQMQMLYGRDYCEDDDGDRQEI